MLALTFGAMMYATLMHLVLLSLMFSPSKSHAAHNLRTGETLDAERSIQQRRDNGAVLWIKPNAGLGVLDW